MADVQDDDQWLYGDEKDETKEDGEINEKSKESKDKSAEQNHVGNSEARMEEIGGGDPEKDKENDKEREKENEGDKGNKDKEGEKDGNEKGDDDSSDEDDLTITIGVLKTQPDIIQAPTAPHQARFQPKQATPTAGLKDEDFTSPGKVNGVPVTEYNMAELEDKPWRKPGADISDYFNYGFNEETWYKYCERQKRMRINESGAGLGGLGISVTKPFGHVSSSIPVTIVNDNSKYGGAGTQRKAGPPPRNRGMGHIDVIGGAANSATKTSTIQVMTADRREYSNKVMNGPPPSSSGPGYDDMEFGGNPYGESYYPGEGQFYGTGGGFDNPPWAGGVPPPSVDQTNWGEGPQPVPPPAVTPVSSAPGYFEDDSMSGAPASSEPEEDRHRSRRHRSRSRSPSRHSRHSSSRHARSRSRSPSHRHKRKKSKRERDAD